MNPLVGWQADPGVLAAASAAVVLYALGVRAYVRRRRKAWPVSRTALFAAGVVSGVVAIESPLDTAAQTAFVPHMIQHLVLTELTAPLVLLGGPLLLALGASSPTLGRRIVHVLKTRVAHVLAFPVVTWALFVVTLWGVHFSPFYEAAIRSEPLHLVEHTLYLGTALLFWLPVIAVGPTPWVDGPLAYPLRMFYLLVAMPAEAFLGFSIFGARHVLYPSYAAAGLADQQAAGELMWIGSGFAMFAAFMLVGAEWARVEQRRDARSALASAPASVALVEP